MIRSLYLKDLAIFSELNMEFHSGLTVITGATGAGKSLIVKSLAYGLGGKGKKVLVSSGRPHSVVEIETSRGTIRRILSNSGRSKSFIDDEPVKENQLNLLIPYRADFHGQHEQQRILNKSSHLDYLDSYADNNKLVNAVQKTHKNILALEKELDHTRKNLAETQTKKDLLEFQSMEIDSVSPEIGEDETLRIKFKKLSNSESLFHSIGELIHSLESGGQSIISQIQDSMARITELIKIDPELERSLKDMDSARISIQEVSNQLMRYQNLIEMDQDECSIIDQRLQEIEELKRKYGGSIESVHLRLKEMREELSSIETDHNKLNALDSELISLKKTYHSNANKLHNSRVISAKKLQSSIEKEMKNLNILKPEFNIHMGYKKQEDSFVTCEGIPVKPTPTGFDTAEFYLSTNPGEEPKPLTDIASGGEISRIMLSIKTVFQSNDPVDTLIFDEIDSGISGETAEKVSHALAKLAGVKQVICISHLPLIASRANHHLHISKKNLDQKTVVDVSYLNQEERITVISQLYGTVKMSGKMEETYRSIIHTAHG
jgi:DNA repair protein RecN (Recombination protein N)